jgi:PAS domain-containing protein
MQNLLLIFTMLCSSGYSLLLDHLAYSSRGIQKALVLPVIILMIVIYYSPVSTWNAYMKHHGRWFFLFGGTVLVQTLIVATGAFQSPFLVLIHLFMIALSFLFSFSIAVIFLLLSLIVLFLDVSAMHNLIIFFQKDLSTIILQMVSFVTIIPMAYIVSQQYHIKEAISNAIRTKVTTDEAILERVNELIIVTDTHLRILSVNDAVERTLQKSRSELIDKPLFDMFLLKDVTGALVKEALLTHSHLSTHLLNTRKSHFK